MPVESTGVPRHLDHLLKILQREEDEMTSEEPGPCLEYLLQHRLLDLLATLASAETPPGIRLVCLSFFKRLLGRSKYPLLHQSAIYGPVRRLIVLCNGNYASPIEPEEVQFLLTLCFLVCKYPHVTNIINESNEFLEKDLHDQNPWEKPEIERVTYSSQRYVLNAELSIIMNRCLIGIDISAPSRLQERNPRPILCSSH